jgi:hypothetical protein
MLVAAAVALPLLSACSDSAPTVALGVAPPDQGSTTPPVVGTPGFSPLTSSGRIYAAPRSLDELYAKYHGASISSRYVLYDDSTFALEFVSGRFGAFVYDGRFTRTDSRITFLWKGWSLAGPWGAEGTLRGDSLSVSYNLVMQMTDFIDGTYGRVPTP